MAFSGSAPEESVEAVPSQGECFIRVGWEPHLSSIQGGRHPEIQSLANRSLPLCLRREPDAPCREAGAGSWGRGSISRSSALGGGGEDGWLRKDLKTSSLPSLPARTSPKPAHHHGRPPQPQPTRRRTPTSASRLRPGTSAAESATIPSGRLGRPRSFPPPSSRLLYPVWLCGAGARWLLRNRFPVAVAAAAVVVVAAVDAVPEETKIRKTNGLQPDRRQTKNSGIA